MRRTLGRAASVIALLIAATASAQNNRSFVATYGSDANDCTAGHECRSFTRALSVTNYGGEVLALTSGGYGPFTITQAVSVIATTGAASITAPSGTNAIDITGFDGDRILLRGLNITTNGTSGVAIFATGYGLLTIENCTVSGGGGGIALEGDSLSRASVADTTVRATAAFGFFANSRAVLTRCRAEKNVGAGVEVDDNGKVTVTEFVSIGNQHGAKSIAFASSSVTALTIDRSVLTDNTLDGVICSVAGGLVAYVFIGNSVVAGNIRYGLNSSTTGTLWTMKNNLVVNNNSGDVNGTTINTLPGQ